MIAYEVLYLYFTHKFSTAQWSLAQGTFMGQQMASEEAKSGRRFKLRRAKMAWESGAGQLRCPAPCH